MDPEADAMIINQVGEQHPVEAVRARLVSRAGDDVRSLGGPTVPTNSSSQCNTQRGPSALGSETQHFCFTLCLSYRGMRREGRVGMFASRYGRSAVCI